MSCQVTQVFPTNAQLFHTLSHCYNFLRYRVILSDLVINVLPSYTSISNKCTIIPQIITLLQVSTLSCHPQWACNQCLAKLHKYFQQMHNYSTDYHTATCFDTIVSSSVRLQSMPCQVTQVFPTNAQLFHRLSHCYMFRNHRVILRELVINTVAIYTSISNAAVGKTIYN